MHSAAVIKPSWPSRAPHEGLLFLDGQLRLKDGQLLVAELTIFAGRLEAGSNGMAVGTLKAVGPAGCWRIAGYRHCERGISAVVEHYLDTVGVTGSNPVARTTSLPLRAA